MKLIPVKDNPGLFRNSKTNNIVNRNQREYMEYQKKKRMDQIKKENEASKEVRINNIENDLSELKGLVKTLIEKIDDNIK